MLESDERIVRYINQPVESDVPVTEHGLSSYVFLQRVEMKICLKDEAALEETFYQKR